MNGVSDYVLHAISLLEQGKSVNDVAFDVGYSSSSSFIAMFQQFAGTTPEKISATYPMVKVSFHIFT